MALKMFGYLTSSKNDAATPLYQPSDIATNNNKAIDVYNSLNLAIP